MPRSTFKRLERAAQARKMRTGELVRVAIARYLVDDIVERAKAGTLMDGAIVETAPPPRRSWWARVFR